MNEYISCMSILKNYSISFRYEYFSHIILNEITGVLIFNIILVWFLSLMAYHNCFFFNVQAVLVKKILVVLYKTFLRGGEGLYLS